MRKKDLLINKFQKYKSTPPENLQARKKLKITKDNFRDLLKKTMQNPDLEPLYDECRNIEWADFVHEKYKLYHVKGKQLVLPRNDKFQGDEIPITWARALINRKTTKFYDKGKEKIKETRIFRYWPSMIITARDIFRGKKERIMEAEVLFPEENPDFNKISWQEFAVEMLQFFKDNLDLVSSPLFKSDINEKFFLIYKNIRGEEIKRHEVPLIENYKNTINKLVKKYRLTELQNISDKDSEYVTHYKEEERHEANIGFWEAIMGWDKTKGHLPSWLSKSVTWHLGNTFDALSTESNYKERLKEHVSETKTKKHFQKKILKESFDSRSGSLDDMIESHDDEIKTKKDNLKGKSIDPEDVVLLSKILSEEPEVRNILEKQRRGEALTQAERQRYRRIIAKCKKKYRLK
jgi:hypothetical protein